MQVRSSWQYMLQVIYSTHAQVRGQFEFHVIYSSTTNWEQDVYLLNIEEDRST